MFQTPYCDIIMSFYYFRSCNGSLLRLALPKLSLAELFIKFSHPNHKNHSVVFVMHLCLCLSLSFFLSLTHSLLCFIWEFLCSVCFTCSVTTCRSTWGETSLEFHLDVVAHTLQRLFFFWSGIRTNTEWVCESDASNCIEDIALFRFCCTSFSISGQRKWAKHWKNSRHISPMWPHNTKSDLAEKSRN